MATQSIFHNIIIQDSKTAEAFVNALENATAVKRAGYHKTEKKST